MTRLLLLCSAAYALKPSSPAPRRALLRTLGAPAALALANLVNPNAALAAGLQDVSVPIGSASTALSKATFQVPSDWVKLSGDVTDGRKMALYADPANADTNAFALITPIRGDYTSLGSFGSVETVLETVMPGADGISYEVIKAEAQSGKYVYEYTVQVPDQPKRHLTTIFMVVADCIVTFNFQAKQTDYTKDVSALSKSTAATFKTGKI